MSRGPSRKADDGYFSRTTKRVIQRANGSTTNAEGNAIAHDATQALGQMRSAAAFSPTAIAVETPATIAVMKNVRIIGTTT